MDALKHDVCVSNCESRKFLSLIMKAGDLRVGALRQSEDSTRVLLRVNDSEV